MCKRCGKSAIEGGGFSLYYRTPRGKDVYRCNFCGGFEDKRGKTVVIKVPVKSK